MIKRIVTVSIAILAISSAIIGYLDMRQNRDLKAEISALRGEIVGGLGESLESNDIYNTSLIVEPTVVRIDVSGLGFEVSGSGFIVRSDGYVITNEHVINGATSIKLTLMQGDTYNSTVVGTDKNRDLALLKIASNRTDFPVATLGSTSDTNVGSMVISAGFPLGLQLPGPASFTMGIVSAKRTLNGLDYIQSDTATNVGSSGSCLVNLSGKVIGVITGLFQVQNIDSEEIALAIPVEDVAVFLRNMLPNLGSA